MHKKFDMTESASLVGTGTAIAVGANTTIWDRDRARDFREHDRGRDHDHR